MGVRFDFMLAAAPNSVREKRTSQSYSRRALASKCGCGKNAIEKIELAADGRLWRGKPARITNTLAESIAATLGADPGDVFENYWITKAGIPVRVKLWTDQKQRDAFLVELLPGIENYIKRKASDPYYKKLGNEEDLRDLAYQALMDLIQTAKERGLPEDRVSNLEETCKYVFGAICHKWQDAIRKQSKIVYRLDQQAEGAHGKIISETADPNKLKAIRQGRIEDLNLARLERSEDFRELAAHLRRAKQMIDTIEGRLAQ